MNILIINGYSVRNFGDAAIVRCMIKIFQRIAPGSRIQVMSSYADDNHECYGSLGAESVSSVWNVRAGSTYLSKYADGARAYFNAVNRSSHGGKCFAEADLIASAGGGYLHSSRRGPFGVGFASSLFHIGFATRFEKPVLLFPQSIGPILWPLEERALKRSLRDVTHIFAREERSAAYVRSLGMQRVSECPDTALILEPVPLAGTVNPLSQGQPKLGVTVLDWSYAIQKATAGDVDASLDRIVAAVERVRGSYPGLHVYVFPHVQVTSSFMPDNDLIPSRRLAEKLGARGTLVDTMAARTPEELAGLYQQMDVFVGSRMHSTIFAMCGLVPTVGLAYQYKTTGTFRLLGLEDCVLPINTFTSDQLAQRVSTLLNERASRSANLAAQIAHAKGAVQQVLAAAIARACGTATVEPSEAEQVCV